jgi:hypothetical protein
MAFGFKWLKPELDQPIYWVHLGIIATVVLGLLQVWKGGDMFSVKNVLMSIPLLAIGDTIAHTVLQLD